MHIGVTDTFSEDNYEQYIHWIKTVNEAIEIRKLSHVLNNLSIADTLDGLLLTGGGDIHPQYYEKENQLAKVKGINERRDEFEFKLIERALDAEIPILGVCRGMQVMNVYLGGSLVMDLVSEGFNDHTSPKDKTAIHRLSVVPHSLLHALIGTTESEVNSFHHQSVARLGKGLLTSAVSPDGVVEAGEWALKDNMPFLMLVQWHPERLERNALSQKLAMIFLREVHQNKLNKRTVTH
jgi:putative glutamine amidotransferase